MGLNLGVSHVACGKGVYLIKIIHSFLKGKWTFLAFTCNFCRGITYSWNLKLTLYLVAVESFETEHQFISFLSWKAILFYLLDIHLLHYVYLFIHFSFHYILALGCVWYAEYYIAVNYIFPESNSLELNLWENYIVMFGEYIIFSRIYSLY